MVRLLCRSLAAAFFVLLLPTVAIWIRSHWRDDELLFRTYTVVPASTPNPYNTDDFYRDEPPEDHAVRKEREARSDSERRTNCEYWISLAKGGVHLSRCIYQVRNYVKPPELKWDFDFGPELYFGGVYVPGSLDGKHWGFLQVDEPYSGGASGGARDASREWDVLFPLWPVAALLAIAPSFWLVGVYRRQRLTAARRRQGKCPNCGYDLRASPELCPECGRVADTSSQGSMPDAFNSAPGWRHELLPVCIGALLLLVLASGGYLLISKRLAAMEQLYANDKTRDAAAEAAETAIAVNDARALRAALTVAPYGPKVTAQLLRGLASEKDKAELACVLLDQCADVRNLPGAILQQATLEGNYVLARALIEKGANVNAPGEQDDRPPLACVGWAEGDEAIALFELLLNKGADPSGRTNPKARTLLHTLFGFDPDSPNRMRIARMLIAKGADVNATADEGEITPLCLAYDDEKDPLVRLLKSKGAEMSTKYLREHSTPHRPH